MMDQAVFKEDINLCTKPRLKLLKSALGLIFTPWLLQRAGELFCTRNSCRRKDNKATRYKFNLPHCHPSVCCCMISFDLKFRQAEAS